jgi:hypothetical protein
VPFPASIVIQDLDLDRLAAEMARPKQDSAAELVFQAISHLRAWTHQTQKIESERVSRGNPTFVSKLSKICKINQTLSLIRSVLGRLFPAPVSIVQLLGTKDSGFSYFGSSALRTPLVPRIPPLNNAYPNPAQ